jgi:hypothetical protein
MAGAKDYSAAIMGAIQTTGDIVDSTALLDALMVITSMVLLGTDDEWTDEGLGVVAAAYGAGVATTLINMAAMKRAGGELPFQSGGTRH